MEGMEGTEYPKSSRVFASTTIVSLLMSLNVSVLELTMGVLSTTSPPLG